MEPSPNKQLAAMTTIPGMMEMVKFSPPLLSFFFFLFSFFFFPFSLPCFSARYTLGAEPGA